MILSYICTSLGPDHKVVLPRQVSLLRDLFSISDNADQDLEKRTNVATARWSLGYETLSLIVEMASCFQSFGDVSKRACTERPLLHNLVQPTS